MWNRPASFISTYASIYPTLRWDSTALLRFTREKKSSEIYIMSEQWFQFFLFNKIWINNFWKFNEKWKASCEEVYFSWEKSQMAENFICGMFSITVIYKSFHISLWRRKESGTSKWIIRWPIWTALWTFAEVNSDRWTFIKDCRKNCNQKSSKLIERRTKIVFRRRSHNTHRNLIISYIASSFLIAIGLWKQRKTSVNYKISYIHLL